MTPNSVTWDHPFSLLKACAESRAAKLLKAFQTPECLWCH